MAEFDPIGVNDPPETSAPLHPEGSRKRYDPRAPSTGVPGGGWEIDPPVITGGGSELRPPPPGGGSTGEVCESTGLPLLRNHVILTGTSEPYATIKVYIADPGPVTGQMVGATQANNSGVWSVRVDAYLPNGYRCLTVTQTIKGMASSAHSEPWCFHIGVCVGGPVVPVQPPQTIDLTAAYLRHDPTKGWYYGTLAYKVDGVWTYGVLRKIGGP